MNITIKKEAAAYITEKLLPWLKGFEHDLLEFQSRHELAVKVGFGFKGVGTVGTVAGAGLAIGGSIAVLTTAPFAIPLIISGIVSGTAGGGVNIVTRIAESVAENKIKNKIKNSEKQYGHVLDTLLSIASDCQNVANFLRGNFQTQHSKIKVWNSLKLYSDSKILPGEIRQGDHIYRRGIGFSGGPKGYFFHHGVCVDYNEETGDYKVIEFGDENPKVVSLKDFLHSETEVFRRNYMGYDASVNETVKLAFSILNNGWSKYDLLKNNCEHFATLLKLKINSSSQVDLAKKIGGHLLKDVPTAGGNAVLAGAAITGAVAESMSAVSLTTRVGRILGMSGPIATTSKAALVTAGKVNVVIAPVLAVVDVALLIHDIVKDDVTKERIETLLQVVEERIQIAENSIEILKR